LTSLSQDYKLLIKVTSKGEIKPFKNGKGKLFSFIMMDEFGTKMQAVCFDKIADKYKDEIIENNIYEITGGYIRTSDKRFDPPGCDYKLILNDSSILIKKDLMENNLKDKFNDPDKKYLTLREVKDANINSIVNVICIVGDKGETSHKDTKGGSFMIRKTLVLDQSNEKMELTLWRHFTQLKINNGDLLVCQKVRVNDFGGKNITTTSESRIVINPQIKDFPEISKEIQALKHFSEQNELNKGIADNDSNNNNSFSKTKKENNDMKPNNNNNFNSNYNNNKNYNDQIVYIDSILDEMDKYVMTDFDHRFPFYKIRATVTHLGHHEKNFYPGCPNRECNRKVSYSNGDWVCQYCRQSFKTPKYYYSLNIRVKDCSSEYWIDIFGKPAELIMNMSADDYRNILVNRDDEKLNQISESVEYKQFYFLLKVRLNKFNDTTKKKFTANKIEKINKKEDTGRLVNDIKKKFKI
jgi:replication factor A1